MGVTDEEYRLAVAEIDRLRRRLAQYECPCNEDELDFCDCGDGCEDCCCSNDGVPRDDET